MKKYRRKPAVVDAWQWPEIPDDTEAVTAHEDKWGSYHLVRVKTGVDAEIREEGDWLIREADGEFHLCKPDIFDALYEVDMSKPNMGVYAI